MAEWSIAAVLKTVDCNRSWGSNPYFSAENNRKYLNNRCLRFFVGYCLSCLAQVWVVFKKIFFLFFRNFHFPAKNRLPIKQKTQHLFGGLIDFLLKSNSISTLKNRYKVYYPINTLCENEKKEGQQKIKSQLFQKRARNLNIHCAYYKMGSKFLYLQKHKNNNCQDKPADYQDQFLLTKRGPAYSYRFHK